MDSQLRRCVLVERGGIAAIPRRRLRGRSIVESDHDRRDGTLVRFLIMIILYAVSQIN